MQGRALTPQQKRAAVERLYAAWLAKSDLRLGQLIAIATHEHNTENGAASLASMFDPFYVEDEPLIAAAERMARR